MVKAMNYNTMESTVRSGARKNLGANRKDFEKMTVRCDPNKALADKLRLFSHHFENASSRGIMDTKAASGQ